MKVIILAGANQRACVALVRSMERLGVDYRVAISNQRFAWAINFVTYCRAASKNGCGSYDESNSKAFIESLLDICTTAGKAMILPTGEKLLRWALAQRAVLQEHGIFLPTVDLDTYTQVSDKQSFARLVTRYDIDVPKALSCLPDRFERPFVIKPKSGTSQVSGVLRRPYLVQSLSDFEQLTQLEVNAELHFFQEFISGPSFYYCAVYNRGNKKLDFCQRTVVQEPNGGSVVKAAPHTLPAQLITKIDTMMADLRWEGAMMVEVKSYENAYYAIECNPRFWGPLQLAMDNGYDFAAALLEEYGSCDRRLVGVQNASRAGRHVGYVWLAGLYKAKLTSLFTQKKMQHYAFAIDDSEPLKFRDVWLRRDTAIYFLVEIGLMIVLGVRSWCRAFRQMLKSR